MSDWEDRDIFVQNYLSDVASDLPLEHAEDIVHDFIAEAAKAGYEAGYQAAQAKL